MILTICALAAASTGSAIFIAHKLVSPKSERVIFSSANSVSKTKEYQLLTKILVDEIKRLKASEKKSQADFDEVVKSFVTVVRKSWPVGTYYDQKQIRPFLNVLYVTSGLELEREIITNSYLDLLQRAVEVILPDCSDAVVRGDDGNHVNDFTYACMNRMKHHTSQFEQYNRNPAKAGI